MTPKPDLRVEDLHLSPTSSGFRMKSNLHLFPGYNEYGMLVDGLQYKIEVQGEIAELPAKTSAEWTEWFRTKLLADLQGADP